jgi:hypothetical protein
VTTTFSYVSHARIEDLQLNECTVHRASNSSGARWWLLWFCVECETDCLHEVFCVPVAPRQQFTESGPGGRTWGLSEVGQSVSGVCNWAVSPSINVLDDRATVAGEHDSPSLWHQTPTILNVPDTEPWVLGVAS